LDVTAEDFQHPALDELMDQAREIVLRGRGAVILSHLPMDEFSAEDYERVYWRLGLMMGSPVIQSRLKDRLGYVRQEQEPEGRGYKSNNELAPHTDWNEVLSLACVQKASEGGESRLANSLTIHNILLEERKDLLAPLYEGFYSGIEYCYGQMPDRAGGDPKQPIYSYIDGQVTCFDHPFATLAARARGIEAPEALIEARAFMMSVAMRDEVVCRFMLEPGEMLFWNNFTHFHSRSAFVNEPGHERLLMRLWIDATDGRPAHPTVKAFVRTTQRLHEAGHAFDLTRFNRAEAQGVGAAT
jgi:hypothetical protein